MSNLGELTFDKLKKQTVKTDKVTFPIYFCQKIQSCLLIRFRQGSYDADMVFKCVGLRPCTEMLKNTFGSKL